MIRWIVLIALDPFNFIYSFANLQAVALLGSRRRRASPRTAPSSEPTTSTSTAPSTTCIQSSRRWHIRVVLRAEVGVVLNYTLGRIAVIDTCEAAASLLHTATSSRDEVSTTAAAAATRRTVAVSLLVCVCYVTIGLSTTGSEAATAAARWSAVKW